MSVPARVDELNPSRHWFRTQMRPSDTHVSLLSQYGPSEKSITKRDGMEATTVEFEDEEEPVLLLLPLALPPLEPVEEAPPALDDPVLDAVGVVEPPVLVPGVIGGMTLPPPLLDAAVVEEPVEEEDAVFEPAWAVLDESKSSLPPVLDSPATSSPPVLDSVATLPLPVLDSSKLPLSPVLESVAALPPPVLDSGVLLPPPVATLPPVLDSVTTLPPPVLDVAEALLLPVLDWGVVLPPPVLDLEVMPPPVLDWEATLPVLDRVEALPPPVLDWDPALLPVLDLVLSEPVLELERPPPWAVLDVATAAPPVLLELVLPPLLPVLDLALLPVLDLVPLLLAVLDVTPEAAPVLDEAVVLEVHAICVKVALVPMQIRVNALHASPVPQQSVAEHEFPSPFVTLPTNAVETQRLKVQTPPLTQVSELPQELPSGRSLVPDTDTNSKDSTVPKRRRGRMWMEGVGEGV